MSVDADVIVIGAGPAGCAAAIPLVQAGRRVLVLERKASEDGADITSGELLAPATQHECEHLGISLDADWVFDRVDGVRNVYPDLSWTYHPLPPGFSLLHVDRGRFNAALRARLVAIGGALRWSARVTGLEFHRDHALVRSDAGEHTARMLIDAGGRYSPSLRLLGLKADDPEFCQIGVALFFHEFEDAVPHTWDRHFYGEHGSMISGSRIRPGLYRYILETDLADKQATRQRPLEFYEHTAQRFDPWLYERIMRARRTGTVWAMAPVGYRVTAVARDRLLLAGDAAGYLAPLTGQGIEFAMRMGRIAAETASQALARNDFTAGAFATYVRGRQDELDTALAYLRHLLRNLRDRERLLQAARDETVRVEIFGPMAAEVAAHGSLRH